MQITAKNIAVVTEYNGQKAEILDIVEYEWSIGEYHYHVQFNDGRKLWLKKHQIDENLELTSRFIKAKANVPKASQIARRIKSNRANKKIIQRNKKALF